LDTELLSVNEHKNQSILSKWQIRVDYENHRAQLFGLLMLTNYHAGNGKVTDSQLFQEAKLVWVGKI
jgi:hypothetical protein